LAATTVLQTDLWREPIATLGQDRGNLRQLLQIQVKRLQRREPRDEQELLFRCVLLFSSRIFCGGDLKNTRYVIFLDSAFSILKGSPRGQMQTLRGFRPMSALTPMADIRQQAIDVR